MSYIILMICYPLVYFNSKNKINFDYYAHQLLNSLIFYKAYIKFKKKKK